jgi:hypothetical protein
MIPKNAAMIACPYPIPIMDVVQHRFSSFTASLCFSYAMGLTIGIIQTTHLKISFLAECAGTLEGCRGTNQSVILCKSTIILVKPFCRDCQRTCCSRTWPCCVIHSCTWHHGPLSPTLTALASQTQIYLLSIRIRGRGSIRFSQLGTPLCCSLPYDGIAQLRRTRCHFHLDSYAG